MNKKAAGESAGNTPLVIVNGGKSPRTRKAPTFTTKDFPVHPEETWNQWTLPIDRSLTDNHQAKYRIVEIKQDDVPGYPIKGHRLFVLTKSNGRNPPELGKLTLLRGSKFERGRLCIGTSNWAESFDGLPYRCGPLFLASRVIGIYHVTESKPERVVRYMSCGDGFVLNHGTLRPAPAWSMPKDWVWASYIYEISEHLQQNEMDWIEQCSRHPLDMQFTAELNEIPAKYRDLPGFHDIPAGCRYFISLDHKFSSQSKLLIVKGIPEQPDEDTPLGMVIDPNPKWMQFTPGVMGIVFDPQRFSSLVGIVYGEEKRGLIRPIVAGKLSTYDEYLKREDEGADVARLRGWNVLNRQFWYGQIVGVIEDSYEPVLILNADGIRLEELRDASPHEEWLRLEQERLEKASK